MTKRIKQLFVTFSALAALALGGAVFASAQTTHSATHEKTAAVDTDNIQSGDQTTPDASTKKATATHEKTAAVDPDNIQSGDQTTPDSSTNKATRAAGQSGSQSAPDTGSVSETASETAGETGAASESAPSDGPGGYADPAGTTADHQFSGVE